MLFSRRQTGKSKLHLRKRDSLYPFSARVSSILFTVLIKFYLPFKYTMLRIPVMNPSCRKHTVMMISDACPRPGPSQICLYFRLYHLNINNIEFIDGVIFCVAITRMVPPRDSPHHGTPRHNIRNAALINQRLSRALPLNSLGQMTRKNAEPYRTCRDAGMPADCTIDSPGRPQKYKKFVI